MTILRPYIPALLLGPGDVLNSVRYNTIPESIAYVEITVPDTLLWSTLGINNIVLGSKVSANNKYSLIKKSIAPGPNNKSWGKNAVLHSIGNYVGNVSKIGQEVDQSGTQW